jgi:hypothetical protein
MDYGIPVDTIDNYTFFYVAKYGSRKQRIFTSVSRENEKNWLLNEKKMNLIFLGHIMFFL